MFSIHNIFNFSTDEKRIFPYQSNLQSFSSEFTRLIHTHLKHLQSSTQNEIVFFLLSVSHFLFLFSH